MGSRGNGGARPRRGLEGVRGGGSTVNSTYPGVRLIGLKKVNPIKDANYHQNKKKKIKEPGERVTEPGLREGPERRREKPKETEKRGRPRKEKSLSMSDRIEDSGLD